VALGGGVLIAAGIKAFFKFQHVPVEEESQTVIKFFGIFSIDTKRGSLCFIVLGTVLFLAIIHCLTKSMETEERIKSMDLQLKAMVPSGAALTLVPFDQLTIEEAYIDQISEKVMQQYRELQKETFNQFLEFAYDEKFVLMVLEAFDKNTFGLANIPRDRIPDIEDLLTRVSSNFPTNIKFQLEIAKIYRSLYESPATSDEEKKNFLTKWGEKIASLKKLPTDDETEKYRVNLMSGLYYQERRELKLALETMSRAAVYAPKEERYKISFNLGNIYLGLAMKEDNKDLSNTYYENSIEEMLKSERDSKEQNIKFWQPSFNLGVIHIKMERYEESIKAFFKASQIAEEGGELDLFMLYLPKVSGIHELCKYKSFADKFSDLCDSE